MIKKFGKWFVIIDGVDKVFNESEKKIEYK